MKRQERSKKMTNTTLIRLITYLKEINWTEKEIVKLIEYITR